MNAIKHILYKVMDNTQPAVLQTKCILNPRRATRSVWDKRSGFMSFKLRQLGDSISNLILNQSQMGHAYKEYSNG